jgi:hypothetical protein
LAKIYKNLQWNIPLFFRVLFLEVEKFAPSSPEKKKKKADDIESHRLDPFTLVNFLDQEYPSTPKIVSHDFIRHKNRITQKIGVSGPFYIVMTIYPFEFPSFVPPQQRNLTPNLLKRMESSLKAT